MNNLGPIKYQSKPRMLKGCTTDFLKLFSFSELWIDCPSALGQKAEHVSNSKHFKENRVKMWDILQYSTKSLLSTKLIVWLSKLFA
jgi:hypothetical protein